MMAILGSCDFPDRPPSMTGGVITFAPYPTESTAVAPPSSAAIDVIDIPDDEIPNSDTPGSDTTEPGVTPTLIAEPGAFAFEDIIFLGDSTTYGLKAYGMLPGGKSTTQVWTPKSGTLTLDHQSYATIVYPPDESEITIREAVGKFKPKAMVITLGVNGVSFMGRESFMKEYADMIDGILTSSPDTKIICQSIFPVAANYKHLKSINNDKIVAANVWVAEVADQKGLRYVDAYSKLVGDDGWLPESYQNGDGLHLNDTSFNIVLSNLKEELSLT
jgi:hypothetical protein